MKTLFLAIIALLPVPVFFYLIMRGVVISKTRWILVTAIILLSGVSVVLVYFIQSAGVNYTPFLSLNGQPQASLTNIFFIGPSEEVVKFIFVFLLVWRSREFRAVYDGIFFSATMAIAFVTIENVYGCLQLELVTAIARLFLSVPLHVAFGVFMGYFLGQARMAINPKLACLYLIRGIVMVSLIHGLIDASLGWSVTAKVFCILNVVPLMIVFTARLLLVEKKKLLLAQIV